MQKTALRPTVQAFPAQKSSAAGRLKIRPQKIMRIAAPV